VRLIKRYKNRKLYDVSTSTYINVIDILKIASREPVQIMDQATGKEITARIIALALSVREDRQPDLMVKEKLLELVRLLDGKATDSSGNSLAQDGK